MFTIIITSTITNIIPSTITITITVVIVIIILYFSRVFEAFGTLFVRVAAHSPSMFAQARKHVL